MVSTPLSSDEPLALKGPINWDATQPRNGVKVVSSGEHKKRSIVKLIVSQLFGLGWLAAIAILLELNFRGWIIGASVGCGLKKNCDYDPFAPNALEEAERFDKRDHNILGALQFVAKALEVWFIALTASLVYNLTMLLAAKKDGLPLGYLMTYVEFSDLMCLFERDFWTSARHRDPNVKWYHRRSIALFSFVGLVAVLCVAANLMGPATAVLVIPTLGWSSLDFHQSQQFGEFGAGGPPNVSTVAPGCHVATLAARNYTCTNIYSQALDELSASISAGTNQSQLDPLLGSLVPGISQESLVTFTFNLSDLADTGIWVPNRQSLRELSQDYAPYSITKISDLVPNITLSQLANLTESYYNRTLDRGLFHSYRNSLQAILHRQGPTISVNGGCYRGNETFINVGSEKSVRCFTGYNGVWSEEYPVKCIRQGAGWHGQADPQAQFFIGDEGSAKNISVNIYSSDQGVYLNNSQVPCSLTPETQGAHACNWSQIFAETPNPDLLNMTSNQQVASYSVPRSTGPNRNLWCDSFSYLNFTDYTLDPSPITNVLNLIGSEGLANVTGTDTIYVHPDWILSAWSIAQNDTIDGTRNTAQNLVAALKSVVNSQPPTNGGDDDLNMQLFVLQHYFISCQALSMINYNTVPAPSPVPRHQDLNHPVLKVSLSLRVWAFGFSSRTSRLGGAVVIFGCVIVIFRCYIAFFTRIKRRKTLELFAAALQHDDQSQFGAITSEREISRIKFRTNTGENGKVAAKMVFVPTG